MMVEIGPTYNTHCHPYFGFLIQLRLQHSSEKMIVPCFKRYVDIFNSMHGKHGPMSYAKPKIHAIVSDKIEYLILIWIMGFIMPLSFVNISIFILT